MEQSPFPRRGLLLPTLLTTALAAGGLMITLDAAWQRARHRRSQPDVRAVVRLLGTADMALSSASRWLRHPSLSEPGAAFADAPAILDADPAGAMIPLPRVLLAGAGEKSLVLPSGNRSALAGEHTRPRVYRPAPAPVGAPDAVPSGSLPEEGLSGVAGGAPATAPEAGALPSASGSDALPVRPESRPRDALPR